MLEIHCNGFYRLMPPNNIPNQGGDFVRIPPSHCPSWQNPKILDQTVNVVGPLTYYFFSRRLKVSRHRKLGDLMVGVSGNTVTVVDTPDTGCKDHTERT